MIEPSAITRCQLIWLLPELGAASAGELAVEGMSPLIVDALSATEHLTCCSFQIGFYIDVDGVPWSDGGTIDEPIMTWSWIRALEQLANGETHAGAHPWEESSLQLAREGDVVVMEDIHGSGHVSMRRVAVPFRELATRMHAELVEMAGVIRAVRAEARARVARAHDDEKLETILRELPGEDEHGLPAIDRLGRALAALVT